MGKRTEEFWRRKHSIGLSKMERIDCTYYTCQYRKIVFANESGLPSNMHWCVHPAIGRANMGYWDGMEAPNWCPRRLNPRTK